MPLRLTLSRSPTLLACAAEARSEAERELDRLRSERDEARKKLREADQKLKQAPAKPKQPRLPSRGLPNRVAHRPRRESAAWCW